MNHKRLLTVLCAALLILQLCCTAFAAENAPNIETTAYYIDDTLYVFTDLPGTEDKEIPVRLMADGVQMGTEQVAEPLFTKEDPAKYLLLVDCSNSMGRYRGRIRVVAEELLSGPLPAELTIASFGTEFAIEADGIKDADALHEALADMEYHQAGTDIGGGAVRAMEHLKSESFESGELCTIVLITDGVPFYADDEAVEKESVRKAADILMEEITASPQILLHSIYMETPGDVNAEEADAVTKEALLTANGGFFTSAKIDEAKLIAQAIAAYPTTLLRLSYPLEEYTEDLALKVGPDFLTVKRTADLTEVPEESLIDSLPFVIDREGDEPEETPAPTETPAPEESKPEKPQLISPTPTPESESSEESPTETPVPEAPEGDGSSGEGTESGEDGGEDASSAEEGSPEESAETTPSPEPDKPGISGALLFIIIGGVVVLLLLAVVLILVLGRSRKKKKAAPKQGPGAMTPDVPPVQQMNAGVPMRLDVLYGELTGASRQFTLTDSFFIGSDRRCDFVLTGPEVAAMHARIFTEGGEVYIEDLNSQTGTALGGMRLHAPNRLRPGDQVMIGQHCVTFHF